MSRKNPKVHWNKHYLDWKILIGIHFYMFLLTYIIMHEGLLVCWLNCISPPPFQEESDYCYSCGGRSPQQQCVLGFCWSSPKSLLFLFQVCTKKEQCQHPSHCQGTGAIKNATMGGILNIPVFYPPKCLLLHTNVSHLCFTTTRKERSLFIIYFIKALFRESGCF